MPSLLIRNGTVILEDKRTQADVLTEDGRITRIAKKIATTVDEVIDAQGRFVLPGVVDAHAHIGDPNFTHREDFRSGTQAAAAGGVTTIIDMVLKTPVDNPEAAKEKIDRGAKQGIVDFSIHAGMMNSTNLGNVEALTQMGICSFKAFMCAPYFIDKATLQTLMNTTAEFHAITNVHAEDEELSQQLMAELKRANRMDPIAHNESKPNSVEEKAIKDAISITVAARSKLHISHMSTSEGVRLIASAKREKVNVTTETCPHYLSLTRADVLKLGPYLKMSPPLKTEADMLALWRGLANGTVDMITSEHAPGEADEKEIGWENIWDAWGGIPTIETMLPIVLSEGVNKDRITIEKAAKVLSENPAKRFGLYPKKGHVAVGADADFVIVDLTMEKKVKASDLHYKVGWTPYEGWILKGWPTTTIVRGRVVAKDGQILAKEGLAQFVPMNMETTRR
ncbi:MAG TPA: allantoinase AllB [Candidatus Acidoferrum sp.]|nr:allantoinase AllB [Candidatus Acidoferrum sp.]